MARLSSRARLVLFILAGIVLLGLGTATAATVAVYRAGTIEIAVEETGGDSLSFSVPAGVVDLALTFAPLVSHRFADELGHADRWQDDMRRFWPAARAALEQVERCPDAVLFEMRDGDETVSIVKRDGTIRFRLDSPRERVHVAVPVRTIGRVSRAFDGWLPRAG